MRALSPAKRPDGALGAWEEVATPPKQKSNTNDTEASEHARVIQTSPTLKDTSDERYGGRYDVS